MANFLRHSRRKWREAGYYVEGTESIVRLPGGVTRRSDLFGFADLVAVPHPDKEPGPYAIPIARGQGDVELIEPWIFLQVTAWSAVSTRLRKIQRDTTGKGQWEVPIRELARRILDAGHRIVIEGWQQEKAYAPWEWREREVELDDLADPS